MESWPSFIGADTASQLQQIIKNAAINGHGKIPVIIGAVSLLLGATAIFGEIQDSINGIWGIKPKPKKSWLKMIQNRLLSFSIIVSLGFLLLVSLSLSSLIDVFSKRLEHYFHEVTVVIFYVLNIVITFLLTTLIFASIFKVLPDAKIKWRDVLTGAAFTSLLFMLGKFAISFYISKSNIGSTYGATGALVVLLLWVYYSSIILYFGAELTKAYAVSYGRPIEPNSYAVTTKTVEVEKGENTIQESQKS